MKLSHRLNTIYQQSLPGAPLWDICCDHGQLGLFAYQNQRHDEVFFVDQVEVIMDNLQKVFERKFHLPENPVKAHFLKKDGGKLASVLTGTVVIAGIGGLNMKTMLLAWQENKVLFASRLVLSPHRDELIYQKAEFLPQYVLTEEKCVLENGHLRFIFVFDLKH
ncbi:MAG: tRNA (adenine(22)-N(1))-methyltransferase TrmK [Bacteriovoracaceae bacterium]